MADLAVPPGSRSPSAGRSPFTSYAGATHGSVLPTAAHDLLRGALT